jgi:hypothetical protein
MRKQIVMLATASKKAGESKQRISTRNPPTEAEIAKAVAAKKPLPGDMALIRSLKLEDEADKFEPIVFSETWYEFSVFVRMLRVHKKTVCKWLDNGWLAYSEVGKMRFINRFDFEDMMMWFRVEAIRN